MIFFLLLVLGFWLWPGGPVAEPLPVRPSSAPALAAPELRFPFFRFPEHLTLCGEAVPLQEQAVRESLDREFIITVWSRAQTTMWLKRAHRYFPEVERKLRAGRLPLDLKYVVLVESDLRGRARSHAGALGPWQFMGPTAQRFQLSVTDAVDERLNFNAATDAALRYLKTLREQLGSWALAMAAYNCGESRVQKEIAVQGVNNYYQLALPEETERYVFRVIAAKVVMEHPGVYGFDLPLDELYGPLQYDEAEAILTQEVAVRSLAAACGTYYKAFKSLNPWIKGSSLPPGKYQFALPKGSTGRFREAQRFGLLEQKNGAPTSPLPKQ